MVKMIKVNNRNSLYGEGPFKVIGETNSEYILFGENTPKNGFRVFKVHCFMDKEAVKETVKRISQKKLDAQKIGTGFRNGKKV